MSDAGLLFLQLIVPAATATVCMIARGSARVQHSIGVMGAAVALAAAAALLLRVDSVGVLAAQAGGWAAPFGITIVADRLAAGMVLISALVGLAVAVYSLRDLRDGALHWEFFPLFHLLLLGVQGSFLTGDLFNLYVWFEVMLVASFVLLTLGNRASQLEGALKYVMLNIVASALFLVGAGLIYGKLGTLNMADIAVKLQDPQEAALLHTSGVLLLAAFGLKAGLFPLFFWLPASYHTPRVAVSAVFAGLLTKVGVYALMRAYTLFFAAKFADLQALLLWVAAATMVTGVLGAAAHFEIRRILSFHIVSQIGYMVLGLALMTPLALAGAIFYLGHHIIVKTNLFFVGGIVEHLRGTGELSKLGGLYKHAPWLAALFFIPAFSLGGIPPLSGFWAKLAVIKAGLEAQAWAVTSIALLVGVLTLFSMTKIWAEAFWKRQPDDHKPPPRPVGARRKLIPLVLPSAVFASLTIVIGLAGGPLFAFAMRASAQLLDPQGYIEAVLRAGGGAP
ncbi:MAG: Na+/H+ antiporter subunit D [Verrucomicrobia bacterium]|jgi:multicomponent Na+:H+ antiporter subunit D|nr:Na+/H+ antiporter subunit D [Verrucomicrobiota bacterium]